MDIVLRPDADRLPRLSAPMFDVDLQHLRLADGKPQVLEIDVERARPAGGAAPIRVPGQDNVHVASVQVAIKDKDGKRLEEGEAVQAEMIRGVQFPRGRQCPRRDLQRRPVAASRELPRKTGSRMVHERLTVVRWRLQYSPFLGKKKRDPDEMSKR